MAITKLDVTRQGQFSGDTSIESHKLTNVLDPTNAQDAATKAYVDATSAGIDWKASVRVATTAAVTLATSFENGDTIDDIVLVTGDRILIKDQVAGADNGIYTVNATGAPTRATDANTSAEVTSGIATFVTEGTTNADSGWVLTTNDPITLGTTDLVFTQFTGLGSITAGAGLSKTGNTINVGEGDGIQADTDTVTVKLHGTSLTKSASGLKITPGTAGQVLVSNAGNTDIVPVTLSGDVASVTGPGVVTLGTTIMRTAGFVDRETPSGAVNGVNTTYTLANTPIVGSEHVYLNGLLQEPGAGNDYTISGATITYLSAPLTGDKIRVSYRK